MEMTLITFITINLIVICCTFGITYLLLFAIGNFLVSCAVIAYNGHMFIAAIFLIVYTGAILVMICVAYLLTPSIKKKKSVKNNSESLNLIYFNLLIILLFSSLILIQLNDNMSSIIDLERNNIFEEQIKNIIIFDDPKNILKLDECFSNLSFDLWCSLLNKKAALDLKFGKIIYALHEKRYDIDLVIDFAELILQSFQRINTINYTNTVSYIYTKHPISFLTIGIYLLITLLICLRMFIIMGKSIIIKRQDIIDQILKIWKKS